METSAGVVSLVVVQHSYSDTMDNLIPLYCSSEALLSN